MKKILLTIFSIALLTFGVQAQESSFGIKGGVNFTNLGSEIEDGFGESNLKTGFHVGLIANLKITQFFALQPEILYSLQGAKFEGNTFFEETKFNLSYINVPVLAKVYFGESFNIHAGPYVGFLVNTGVEYGDDADFEDAFEDAYKTLDFGIAGGLEFETATGLFLGARYNLGLADIRNDDNETLDGIEDLDNDSNVHNQNIQAYIGIMF